MELIFLISQYSFILWLGAAFFLFRSGRYEKALPIGLGLVGTAGLLSWIFAKSGPELAALAALVRLVGIGFIVAACFRAMRASTGIGGSFSRMQAYSYLNPTEASMETLVIARNETNSYTRAETVRDDLYTRITQICTRNKVNVIGYKSAEKSGFVWVRFDYQLPQERADLSLRASLTITVDRFDFHRFEHLLTVQTTVSTRTKHKAGLIELTDGDIEALNAHLSRGEPYPHFNSGRSRVSWYQFWLPRNKVERLGKDWAVIGFTSGIVCSGLLVSCVPLLGFPALIATIIALAVFQHRRKVYILTTGKPLHDPRQLLRLDSWQVNIAGLGTRCGEVRDALRDRLCSSVDTGIQVVTERIWYPGIDGKVERDQIVCTFRRAVGFLAVEAYGDDLYVGWDTHVNSGTWMEQTLARGVDRLTNKFVLANRVIPGRQAPNEYDITDANFLTEWLHANLVKLLRLKMAEHQIDQEIDFKVQRESRKDLLFEMQAGGSGANDSSRPKGRFAARLRRVE